MIYTIGHSHHPIERFIALLQPHGIDALADVRSTPYSRFNPQFNREKLQASLATAGIRYVILGEESGARTKDPSCYDDTGRVSYARLDRSEPFRRGLERLLTGIRDDSGLPRARKARRAHHPHPGRRLPRATPPSDAAPRRKLESRRHRGSRVNGDHGRPVLLLVLTPLRLIRRLLDESIP